MKTIKIPIDKIKSFSNLLYLYELNNPATLLQEIIKNNWLEHNINTCLVDFHLNYSNNRIIFQEDNMISYYDLLNKTMIYFNSKKSNDTKTEVNADHSSINFGFWRELFSTLIDIEIILLIRIKSYFDIMEDRFLANDNGIYNSSYNKGNSNTNNNTNYNSNSNDLTYKNLNENNQMNSSFSIVTRKFLDNRAVYIKFFKYQKQEIIKRVNDIYHQASNKSTKCNNDFLLIKERDLFNRLLNLLLSNRAILTNNCNIPLLSSIINKEDSNLNNFNCVFLIKYLIDSLRLSNKKEILFKNLNTLLKESKIELIRQTDNTNSTLDCNNEISQKIMIDYNLNNMSISKSIINKNDTKDKNTKSKDNIIYYKDQKLNDLDRMMTDIDELYKTTITNNKTNNNVQATNNYKNTPYSQIFDNAARTKQSGIREFSLKNKCFNVIKKYYYKMKKERQERYKLEKKEQKAISYYNSVIKYKAFCAFTNFINISKTLKTKGNRFSTNLLMVRRRNFLDYCLHSLSNKLTLKYYLNNKQLNTKRGLMIRLFNNKNLNRSEYIELFKKLINNTNAVKFLKLIKQKYDDIMGDSCKNEVNYYNYNRKSYLFSHLRQLDTCYDNKQNSDIIITFFAYLKEKIKHKRLNIQAFKNTTAKHNVVIFYKSIIAQVKEGIIKQIRKRALFYNCFLMKVLNKKLMKIRINNYKHQSKMLKGNISNSNDKLNTKNKQLLDITSSIKDFFYILKDKTQLANKTLLITQKNLKYYYKHFLYSNYSSIITNIKIEQMRNKLSNSRNTELKIHFFKLIRKKNISKKLILKKANKVKLINYLLTVKSVFLKIKNNSIDKMNLNYDSQLIELLRKARIRILYKDFISMLEKRVLNKYKKYINQVDTNDNRLIVNDLISSRNYKKESSKENNNNIESCLNNSDIKEIEQNFSENVDVKQVTVSNKSEIIDNDNNNDVELSTQINDIRETDYDKIIIYPYKVTDNAIKKQYEYSSNENNEIKDNINLNEILKEFNHNKNIKTKLIGDNSNLGKSCSMKLFGNKDHKESKAKLVRINSNKQEYSRNSLIKSDIIDDKYKNLNYNKNISISNEIDEGLLSNNSSNINIAGNCKELELKNTINNKYNKIPSEQYLSITSNDPQNYSFCKASVLKDCKTNNNKKKYNNSTKDFVNTLYNDSINSISEEKLESNVNIVYKNKSPNSNILNSFSFNNNIEDNSNNNKLYILESYNSELSLDSKNQNNSKEKNNNQTNYFKTLFSKLFLYRLYNNKQAMSQAINLKMLSQNHNSAIIIKRIKNAITRLKSKTSKNKVLINKLITIFRDKIKLLELNKTFTLLINSKYQIENENKLTHQIRQFKSFFITKSLLNKLFFKIDIKKINKQIDYWYYCKLKSKTYRSLKNSIVDRYTNEKNIFDYLNHRFILNLKNKYATAVLIGISLNKKSANSNVIINTEFSNSNIYSENGYNPENYYVENENNEDNYDIIISGGTSEEHDAMENTNKISNDENNNFDININSINNSLNAIQNIINKNSIEEAKEETSYKEINNKDCMSIDNNNEVNVNDNDNIVHQENKSDEYIINDSIETLHSHSNYSNSINK